MVIGDEDSALLVCLVHGDAKLVLEQPDFHCALRGNDWSSGRFVLAEVSGFGTEVAGADRPGFAEMDTGRDV